ncbi:MAG: hypothetical protein LJE58_02820 [Thiogranum sp.]|jgi:hypothetical protein|nr:hypothetical protein [Thiogranum sp.]
MTQSYTTAALEKENRVFSGTPGVSRENRGSGFRPAFCDTESGRVELSRFANGLLAPVHLFDGLPESWIVAGDATAGVTAIKQSVVAGFERDGCFYTRKQAAEAVVSESRRSFAWGIEPAYV